MHSQALPTTVRAHQPLSEPAFLALPLSPRSVTVSLVARSTSVMASSAAAPPVSNADVSNAASAAADKVVLAPMALPRSLNESVRLGIVEARPSACQALVEGHHRNERGGLPPPRSSLWPCYHSRAGRRSGRD